MNYPYYSPSEITAEAQTSPEAEAPAPIPPSAPTPVGEGDPASVRRHFSKLGAAYLIMTVAFMAVAYAAQFAVAVFYPDLFGYWWFSWAMSLFPLYGVGLPVLLICLRRVPRAPHNALYRAGGLVVEKPAFGAGQWFTLLVIAFGCMTMGGLIGNYIMSVLSVLTEYDYAFALNSMVDDTPVWFTAICTCVCAPFGEELLFRKLLVDRARRYGDLTAILLSGLLFGLFHGNLFQFFYAAAVGMVLAYLYTRTGKYLLCVAMHAAINFMGSVVLPAISKLATPLLELANASDLETAVEGWVESESLATLIPAILALLVLMVWQYGMLAAAIALLCTRFRKRVLSDGEIPLSDPPALSWLNPGTVACLAVMMALMALSLIPAG